MIVELIAHGFHIIRVTHIMPIFPPIMLCSYAQLLLSQQLPPMFTLCSLRVADPLIAALVITSLPLLAALVSSDVITSAASKGLATRRLHFMREWLNSPNPKFTDHVRKFKGQRENLRSKFT